MSLFIINKRLKRGQYSDIKELASDLFLIFDNAHLYNLDSSPIYRAAESLRNLTQTFITDFTIVNASHFTNLDFSTLGQNSQK